MVVLLTRLLALTAFFCVCSFNVAHAASRALLIGVSDYAEGIGLTDLAGPANDVRLMREVLHARGIGDITVLADGVDGGALPTRANILAAFAALADSAQQGDLLIVHISGHGTRQPDGDGDERDGYDEVFLPADVARAAPGERHIPNALIDDEIGQAVTAMRRAGGDVWLIVDSCHSGTVVRAGSDAVRSRAVRPSALGLTERARIGLHEDGVAGGAPSVGALPPDAGGLIAFYAAQATEEAREVDYSRLAGATSEDIEPAWYGFFTAKLAARLRHAGALTYRQLFQAVLSDMNTTTLPSGGARQTPYWEGTLAGAQIFGGQATQDITQHPVQGRRLSAGLVQGLETGTVLRLVADAADEADEADDVLGHAQIEKILPLAALLRPVAGNCLADAETLCPALAAPLPEQARFARVQAVPVSLRVRLSPPFDINDPALGPVTRGRNATTDALLTALDEALTAPAATLGGRFEADANAYDVALGVANGRLWFGETVRLMGEPSGLSWGLDDALPLPDILAQLAYTQRLRAAAEAIAAGSSILRPSPVTIETYVERADAELLHPPGAAIDPLSECGEIALFGAHDPAQPLDSGAPLKQCDIVTPTLRARGGAAVDVNRLYIDAGACVWAEHERLDGPSAERPFGTPLTLCSECGDGPSVVGVETLLTLITEAVPNTAPLNLEGRVENCADVAPTRTGAQDGMAMTPLGAFLQDALDAQSGTRGRLRAALPPNIWVARTDWQVIPRAAAKTAAISVGGSAPDNTR